MSRKQLVIAVSALVLMVIGIAVAVCFLYIPDEKAEKTVDIDYCYDILSGVPSDAMATFYFRKLSDASNLTPFSTFQYPAAISWHFRGEMKPLYVFDLGEGDLSQAKEEAATLISKASAEGFRTEAIDCRQYNNRLCSRNLLLVCRDENLLKASLRHISSGHSILDVEGFPQALSKGGGGNVAVFPNSQANRLLSQVFSSKELSSKTEFFNRLSAWVAVNLDEITPSSIQLSGSLLSSGNDAEFATVLSSSAPSSSQAQDILPYTTVSALCLTPEDFSDYASAYREYLNAKNSLQATEKEASSLKKVTGVSVEDFVKTMKVKEAVCATIVSSGGEKRVNVLRCNPPKPQYLLADSSAVKSFKAVQGQVLPYRFSGYLANILGKEFRLEDESFFTLVDNWLISGDSLTVAEYAQGGACDYPLKEYFRNAECSDFWQGGDRVLTAYFSFGASESANRKLFSKGFLDKFSDYVGQGEFRSALLTISDGKSPSDFSLNLVNASLRRTKAPTSELDTTVVVPQGPFKVKNSATGKTNILYKNEKNYLCLKEEDGKGLWGIPFDGNFCGRVCNVDYFANGKIQFLFASGDKLYLVDRLGRFVGGFPVTLDSAVRLGPDVYDFSGAGKYNAMVLHKDNHISMYNLKGVKPQGWTDITCEEKIKGLPERLVVGGSNFWVVRTSLRTLIYPFLGAAPFDMGEGDQMARPDTQIEIVDDTSVKYMCFDGKSRTLNLK